MGFVPPTIKDRGGLRAHLASLMVDYDLFKQLRDLYGGERGEYAAIAKGLSKNRPGKPLNYRTIKHWCEVDDAETAEKNGK